MTMENPLKPFKLTEAHRCLMAFGRQDANRHCVSLSGSDTPRADAEWNKVCHWADIPNRGYYGIAENLYAALRQMERELNQNTKH